MRISIKCSSAIHILLMIAVMPDSCKLTSEFLAYSVGNNPVEIRKLLSRLKKSNIIDVSRGTGGAKLLKEANKITLFDIYDAVDSSSLDELIGVHSHPAQECPFGKNITGKRLRYGKSLIQLHPLIGISTMFKKFYKIILFYNQGSSVHTGMKG